MRLISSILKFFVTLIFLGVLVYAFRDYIPYSAPVPCTEPMPYSLGTFDKKFNISEKYFLDALKEAEVIWEKPYNKDLFVYVPEGSPRDLKINLIYDYRQQATEKLAGLGIVVDDNRTSYDSLKVKFEALKKEYEQEKSIFNARVKAFNQRNEAYEKEVNFWNKKGGAPEGEFNKLEQERIALQAEAKTLETMQNKVNNTAEEINALVVAINRLAGILNLSVEKYNDINIARGESFEEGVYAEEGIKREIDIYEFSTKEKLVRVLAHELGHALRLDHVKDPKAIMYEFNQGNNTNLTEADLAELKLRCEGKY
ncbi:matrixin family metalloprotease [Candidatus Nomurabacteria bacterium]|nr:matrixin family metalloprotease [Candidatus Nomurabacteria bacterium]